MDRLTTLSRRAKHIYQSEGLIAMLRRGFLFLDYCFLDYREYWLYADPTPNGPTLNEADFMPRVDDFTFRIVTSNQQADEMEIQGLEFRSQVPNVVEKLDKGAVSFCVFVGSELAHIGWVATTQEARDCIGEPPYRVDFANHETCLGGIWTSPKYRRLGLRRYARFKLDELLLSRNVVRSRGAILKSNTAAIRSRPEHFPPPYAEGRYLRILWWKSWREMPLSAEEQEAMRQTNGSHS